MTQRKLFISSIVAVLALSACGQSDRYEPIHADEIIAQQEAKRNVNPYENMGAYDSVFTVAKEDLLDRYAIKGVDFPDAPSGITMKSAKDRDSWIDSFYGEKLDPAIVRVLTEDNERHEYRVLLVDDKAVLLSIQDDSPAPNPDEFKKATPDREAFESLEDQETIEQDLQSQYHITGVEFPEGDESSLFKNSATDWWKSFRKENLDPALIKIRTEDYNVYDYEVTLENDRAVLYPLTIEVQDTGTDSTNGDTAPNPEELLR